MKYIKHFKDMERNEALQKKMKTIMYVKNIPFNKPFDIEDKKYKGTYKINKDIDGNYELQAYCSGIWLPTNKEKLSVSDVLLEHVKIKK